MTTDAITSEKPLTERQIFERDRFIASLRAKGWSFAGIARHLLVSEGYVRQACRDRGVE